MDKNSKSMSPQKSEIIKNNIIAVYGLGNVGGAIAAVWLKKGAKVIGVDISTILLDEIREGKSHKKEPYVSEIFTKSLKNKTLSLTTDGISASNNSTIKIISVPVGLKKNKIDLLSLIAVSKNISKGMKKGDVVIISPSLPPGTTVKIILPILEKSSGLKGEKDFFLIYNPERIFEGRAIDDIEKNYPAIVGGLGIKSATFGKRLLELISQKGVILMSSIATAEAEKLFEGVYRDVNIALANELAEFCDDAGVNYWEARTAANSQPYCHLHYPGTGVGGLCIPVYPKFVIEESMKHGKHLKIIEYARMINDNNPKKCVIDAITLLLKHKISKKGAKIAILGLGFRGDVTDTRLSPTYTVMNEFLKRKYTVSIHDPYITNDISLPKNVYLSNDLTHVTSNVDLIFISTDHKMYAQLNTKSFSNANKPLLIFDGRNILNKENFKNQNIVTIGMKKK